MRLLGCSPHSAPWAPHLFPPLLHCPASERVWFCRAAEQGGCASPWATAQGAQAQALFGEWDGKVLVNAEVMLQGGKLRALQVTKQSGGSGWTMQQNPSSQNGIVRNYFFLFSIQQMDPLFGESRKRIKSSLCKKCFPP